VYGTIPPEVVVAALDRLPEPAAPNDPVAADVLRASFDRLPEPAAPNEAVVALLIDLPLDALGAGRIDPRPSAAYARVMTRAMSEYTVWNIQLSWP
jgi:hypothetical protein